MRTKRKQKTTFIREYRKTIFYIGTGIFAILLLISLLLMNTNSKRNEVQGVQYQDKQSLDYKVALKANKYYENSYSEKDNQYISSLIDHIEADFKYNFKIVNDLKYDYTYKILADVDVKDNKTTKSIYSFSEVLVPEKKGNSADGDLSVNELINLDYNKYDELIREFVTIYELNNATSKVTLTLVVGVDGVTEKFSNKEIPVMSLDIPLGLTTISIDTNYDLAGNSHIIQLASNKSESKVGLVFGIILLVMDALAYTVFVMILNTYKTDEDKYDDNIRKIMNNYDSYISKIDEKFDVTGYQILRVEKFVDLLEIRDTMQLPIIMMENKDKKLACFYIATTSKLLYFYSISVKQYALPKGE